MVLQPHPDALKGVHLFGDNGRGKVRGLGAVRVSDRFTLREVALVSNLGFNLLSVSQLLDEGFEVRFKEGCSRVLDSRGRFGLPDYTSRSGFLG